MEIRKLKRYKRGKKTKVKVEDKKEISDTYT